MIAPPEFLALIKRHEGDRPRAYRDSKGIWTVGVGRNLLSTGLSREEVISLLQVVDLPVSITDLMLQNDIEVIAHQVAGVIGDDVWPTLAPARQWALVDMGFMGPGKLYGFSKMIAAVRIADWATAAAEALNSQWANDVGPTRSGDVAQMLLTGAWPAGT